MHRGVGKRPGRSAREPDQPEVPEALERLTGEERSRLYRMLRLEVAVTPEGGYRIAGTFCSYEHGRLAVFM